MTSIYTEEEIRNTLKIFNFNEQPGVDSKLPSTDSKKSLRIMKVSELYVHSKRIYTVPYYGEEARTFARLHEVGYLLNVFFLVLSVTVGQSKC